MLGNDRMETVSTKFTSVRRRIHVEISMSNPCHNFHVDSPFKIDEISTNFPRGTYEDVSVGRYRHNQTSEGAIRAGQDF